ncbi:MAG: hypothetical protein CMJ83_01900, partial [Planctomycetes bacterium]|nr:hypothetical protein [Planctomycetota bacterium]
LAAVVVVAVAEADRRVWVGRYEGFHVLMTALIAFAGWMAGALFQTARPGRPGPIVTASVVVAALGLPLLIAVGLVPGDHPLHRDLLLNRSPSTGRVLIAATQVSRTRDEPVDEGLVAEVSSNSRTSPAALDRLVPDRKRMNLLWVTFDTVRADRVGAYGYDGHPTTPNLDRFASESIRFDTAWSQHPSSQLAMGSMFAGLYPMATEVARELSEKDRVEGPFDDPVLAQRLRAAGFTTEAVTALSSGLVARLFLHLPKGFEYFNDYPHPGLLDAKDVTDHALRALERAGGRWFLWVHYFDPHSPYRPHGEFEFGTSPSDVYDGEIAWADRHFGRLLDAVRAREDWDRTAVVIHADHGEEFGEHNGRFHHSSLFEEQIRVPMILRVPGLPPAVVPDPVGVIDVADTFYELFGLPPNPRTHGRSLLSILVGDQRRKDTFAQFYDASSRVSRIDAVRGARWKLIYKVTTDTWHLFDLDADPGEQKDVAADHPDELGTWKARLLAYRALTRGARPQVQPSLEEMSDRELQARLRELSPDDREKELGRIVGGPRTPSVLPVMHWAVSQAPTERERLQTLAQLGLWQYEPAVATLIEHLTHESERMRKIAAQALCHFDDAERIASALFDVLSREKGAVRWVFDVALAVQNDERPKAELLQSIDLLSSDQLVWAGIALQRLGFAPLGPALAGCVQNRTVPWGLDVLAIRSLARSRSLPMLTAVHSRLQNLPTSFSEGLFMLRALRDYPPEWCVSVYRELLARRHSEIRDATAEQLRELDRAGWIPSLREVNRRLEEIKTNQLEDGPELLALVEEMRAHGLTDWGIVRTWWRDELARRQGGRLGVAMDHLASKSTGAPEPLRALMRQMGYIAAGTEHAAQATLSAGFGTAKMIKGPRAWVQFVEVKLSPTSGSLPGGPDSGAPLLRVRFVHQATQKAVDGPVSRLPFPGILEGEKVMVMLRAEVPDLPPGEIVAEVRLDGRAFAAKAEPLMIPVTMMEPAK